MENYRTAEKGGRYRQGATAYGNSVRCVKEK